ncbi:MAG: homoserine O-acetyltransferase [Acidobacteriota bacterium]
MVTDHRQYITFGSPEEPFRLQAGGSLSRVTIAFETWGNLSPERDNLILVTTGLSASSHAARHAPDDVPGWWDVLIGPGCFIDTHHWFVVCTNVLGGCFGSSGPSSLNPATNRPYALDFPMVTVEDMVHAQVKVLDHLGVDRIFNVIGSSLGGMLALQWGALYPERVRSLCAIAASARSYSFSIAWRAIQRWMVMSDPEWKGGSYAPGKEPVGGLTQARSLGILSYRSPEEFDQRFDIPTDLSLSFSLEPAFPVESYLRHNAAKFGRTFDANSYLYLARAMDFFDLARGMSSLEEGVCRITAPLLVIGFTSDLLFPIHQQRELHRILRERGRPVSFHEFHTIHGHDAFLIEAGRLGRIVRSFLNRISLPEGS